MKNNKTPKTSSPWIIILLLIVFVLLGFAFWKQYGELKELFAYLGDSKYLLFGLFAIIPILILLFAFMVNKAKFKTKRLTKHYFGLNAKDEDKLISKDDKYAELVRQNKPIPVPKVKQKESEKEESSDDSEIKLVNPQFKMLEDVLPKKRKKKAKQQPVVQPTQPIAPIEEVVEPAQEEIQEVQEEVVEEAQPSRFYMLTQIDKEMETYEAPEYDNKVSLYDLCESFRNFASNKLRLYYDIEDIRRFIGGLSVTKMIILQGMSGTGKTSLAYAFGEYLRNTTVVVPIQPMWKERTDLIGYYNEFTKKFNETTLLYKMYEANYNKEIYITVLDEMNIARVEYYFAEFLSLLELPNPEGRNLDVVSDKWDTDPKQFVKGKIRLPINMWFIGTINNDDSTFAISDKVYDRAMVLNLNKKAKPFEAPETTPHKISSEYLQELFVKAQKEYSISDRNLRRISALDKYMIENFKLTFGNRIMKQIHSYVPVIVACGGTELQALDDILSTKVFRKLEAKNPVYVRQMADAVCTYLDELFGVDKMPLCKEAIRLIEQNI